MSSTVPDPAPPTPELPTTLGLRTVSKTYGSAPVLRDVDLDLPPGAITVFIGPNGAGKSTAIRAMAGVSTVDAGEVTGSPARAGFCFGPEYLPGAYRARTFLRLIATLTEQPKARVDEMLATVGLAGFGKRRIRTLSTGQRQRLAVAAAILADPAVLVLDEPFNGLDPDGVHWLRELVLAVSRRGGAVLLSTHILAEADLYGDRYVMIIGGRTVAAGPLGGAGDAVRVRTPRVDDLRTALAAESLPFTEGAGGVTVHAPAERVFDLLHRARIVPTGFDSASTLEAVYAQHAAAEHSAASHAAAPTPNGGVR